MCLRLGSWSRLAQREEYGGALKRWRNSYQLWTKVRGLRFEERMSADTCVVLSFFEPKT